MSYPSLPTRVERVLLAAVFTGAVAWYSPLLRAGSWHLFHPRGWIDYRGLRVRVPWPWFADASQETDDSAASPQGLSIKKTPFTLNRLSESETIFVTVITPDPGVTAEREKDDWLRAFRAAHPSATVDPTPLAIVPGANCLRARNPGSYPELVWTCISVAGGWVADMEGQRADEPVFFEIVTHLKSRDTGPDARD